MDMLVEDKCTGTPWGTGVTDGFEPSNMGAGNQAWVLWKSNHLSSLLLLLSITFDFLISPQTPPLGLGLGRESYYLKILQL